MYNKLHLTRRMHLKLQSMSSKANRSRFIYYSRSSRYFLAQSLSDSMQLDLCAGQPTFTMPVFSELLFIMSLKDVKRFLKDSMKSASPLFS